MISSVNIDEEAHKMHTIIITIVSSLYAVYKTFCKKTLRKREEVSFCESDENDRLSVVCPYGIPSIIGFFKESVYNIISI